MRIEGRYFLWLSVHCEEQNRTLNGSGGPAAQRLSFAHLGITPVDTRRARPLFIAAALRLFYRAA
jgi:hypothetical protein